MTLINTSGSVRFNSYSEYFKRTFGSRMQKVSVDAGFTCPNRDGTKGTGGCSFCNNDAFNPSYCQPAKSIRQQILEGIEFHSIRYRRASKYLAYFQPYSNTYASLGHLKNIYEEALSVEGVEGIVLGTRPDCMYPGLLDYLTRLSKQYYVMVEYGVESCYENTLIRIQRGHTYQDSVEAIRSTAARGIMTGAHLIFGLPGESREQMLAEAGIISELPVHSLKLHHLQIVKGTRMAEEYESEPGNFHLFSLEEYIDFVIDFTELLNPAIMIERFLSEVPPRYLLAPNWGKVRYDQVLTLIKKRMEERNSWQGRLYVPGNSEK